jgi:hypothetical protein
MRPAAGWIVAGVLLTGGPSRAQEARVPTMGESLLEGVRFFAPLIVPKVFQDAYQLREFVCSDAFAALRRAHGDLHAVDSLFSRARDLALGNRGEALLISMIVTMDHRRVTFTVPLLGPILTLPLTSESEADFATRLAALPVRLYEDTPEGAAGDRDKLQHFFGSAFVAYAAESEEQADAVGRIVEQGERRYVPGEHVDPRDLRANRQGQRFARALASGRNDPPSTYLRSRETTDEAVGGE